MGILDRSESRQGATVIWLAVHSTEGDDNPLADDARALRDATWWTGSSHAIADDEPGTLLTPADGCVPYDRAAWTIRGGNRYSDNIELVGRASWPRATWLAQPRLLDLCARWLADRHKARPWIPLRRLSLEEIRARKPGVIGHADYTDATGDGTHWDPGPGFPWDVVLAQATAYAAPAVPTSPATPSEEDIDMLIVWIPSSKPDVLIPHLLTGDRYLALDSVSTARAMEKAGVRSVQLGQGAHAVFATSLRSETPPGS